MMTPEEKEVIDLSARLWNALIALPDPHEWDNQEHMHDIHNIQARIMARSTRRDHPETFR